MLVNCETLNIPECSRWIAYFDEVLQQHDKLSVLVLGGSKFMGKAMTGSRAHVIFLLL